MSIKDLDWVALTFKKTVLYLYIAFSRRESDRIRSEKFCYHYLHSCIAVNIDVNGLPGVAQTFCVKQTRIEKTIITIFSTKRSRGQHVLKKVRRQLHISAYSFSVLLWENCMRTDIFQNIVSASRLMGIDFFFQARRRYARKNSEGKLFRTRVQISS